MIAEQGKPFWLDLVTITSKAKVQLPMVLRRRVSWATPEASLALLAVLSSDGSVCMSPLKDRRADLDRLSQTLSECEPDECETLVFAAMATYNRVTLQPDGRLRLSPLLAHALDAKKDGVIWVGAYRESITLWSEAAWSGAFTRGVASLEAAIASNETPGTSR
ncbi:hypothetical protein [Aurantiacibacter spongiae]|uniref:Transcriptional regulator MraZ n=1 Tax=Aurantiacibacter spongiae TaxID=2488860 RepID=A0A3N5CWU7_9SPHN|nr:hypothetical protein [Aurantiacibacter spongiae]RPF71129.1 hypothetical protein EG799_05510 [Aurantiacibacter spongiae]